MSRPKGKTVSLRSGMGFSAILSMVFNVNLNIFSWHVPYYRCLFQFDLALDIIHVGMGGGEETFGT
jgi:hypothetical protein